MEWGVVLVLFGVFFALMLFSVPVSFSIGIATVATICLSKTFEQANFLVAQKMITGLDSFALLALPFFILAGNIMNRGGIAMRLINLAMVMVGRLPGALAHCNILANMLFGAVSGSAVASAAAVGSTMAPMQRKEGYDPGYSAAVNIASCPTGLLIPPSNTFIVYSLISGGTSVAALFLAGYLPGILMGGGLMIVAGIIAKKRGYPVAPRVGMNVFLRAVGQAILPLSLVIVIIGGIIKGTFTATEGSAIAVVYALFLAMVIYREIKIRDLPKIFLDSMVTTAIVLLLIGCSMGDELGDGQCRYPLHYQRRFAGNFREQNCVAAGDQSGAAGGRVFHGHDPGAADLYSDFPADCHRSWHGPGTFRDHDDL